MKKRMEIPQLKPQFMHWHDEKHISAPKFARKTLKPMSFTWWRHRQQHLKEQFREMEIKTRNLAERKERAFAQLEHSPKNWKQFFRTL